VSGYRLGVDIGGTFTDVILVDEESGAVHIDKVLTTPRDPSIAFLDGVERVLRRAGAAPARVRYVVHATTVATNAIIEGKAARTAFVTTDGFRDMLEIARQVRPSLYDLRFEKPRPLVPRQYCYGVPERLDAHGQVLVPLDEAAVRRVADEIARERIEAIAVCFLHAYANAAHEQLAGRILREALPETVVSLSSEVAPEFREYFRASTTVINASIQPIVSRYLAHIEARLRAIGASAELLVMQSNGGVFSFTAAREKPVFMVESGPAAGVIAAAHLGATLGYPNAISFDMGGTTTKAGLILDGTPRATKEYEVGTAAHAGVGSQRGSGYPIRTPVIDLVEIGAGGGSIAWIDSGGGLRVGPTSAGADPGPACYGRGGIEPTITDANLVLGRLNPDYFLGGELRLDVERARGAIAERCAAPLGIDVVAAAHGIVEIANAAMVNALRLVSVQRGYDPREFALIAFGGAGPVHANRLIAETQIRTALIPTSPGTASAMGLLVSDLRHEYSVTMIERLDRAEIGVLEQVFQTLEAEGRRALAREGSRPDDVSVVRQMDLRYVGQGYELTVAVPAAPLDSEARAGLIARFHDEHGRAYGYSAPAEPVELVNVRVTVIGAIAKPALRRGTVRGRGLAGAPVSRPVYFQECGGYVDCPVYDRYHLAAEMVVRGPAIIEEFDSSTAVHPGYHACADAFGTLHLSAADAPAQMR